ncbi:hypothetical protein GXW82_23965 [Streptacidiphilus sp. 4-A2]|nr:hypothetical protein [Streptacidiphilus sp. 4-A2]
MLYVWKDVPFAISAVLVFAATTRLVAKRSRGLRSLRARPARIDVLILVAGLLGLGLFRNNGVGFIVLIGVALVLAMTGLRKGFAIIAVVCTAVGLACNLLIYPAIGIKPAAPHNVYGLNYADIAVVYAADPGIFTRADLTVMKQVTPLSSWKYGGDCWDADTLTSHDFNAAAADRVNGQLVSLWFKLLQERPDIIADSRICHGNIAWSPFAGPANLWGFTAMSTTSYIPANLWGYNPPSHHGAMSHSKYLPVLKTRPLSTTLHRIVTWWHVLSQVPQLQWLLWRGATWCYIGYAAVILYVRRRGDRRMYALAGYCSDSS